MSDRGRAGWLSMRFAMAVAFLAVLPKEGAAGALGIEGQSVRQ